MWRFQPRCLEFSTPPLFPETADHTCSLSVRTCFIHQHFPFLLALCPSAVPFPFARGKSPVFESVRGREARIDRWAVVGRLSKVVVLEVGDTLGGRTPRQQDKSSTLCHRDKDVELWLWNCGKFADIAVICIVLGTQPVHIGALFSVDHSCDNRVLGYFNSYQKTGGIWRGKNLCFLVTLSLKHSFSLAHC